MTFLFVQLQVSTLSYVISFIVIDLPFLFLVAVTYKKYKKDLFYKKD